MMFFIALSTHDSLWNDRTLVTTITASAIAMLVAMIWLLQRRKRSGRGAAMVCLVLSIALHGLLIYYLPKLTGWGNSVAGPTQPSRGADEVTITQFDPMLAAEVEANTDSLATEPSSESPIAPLPLQSTAPEPPGLLQPKTSQEITLNASESSSRVIDQIPESLAVDASEANANDAGVDDLLAKWLSEEAERKTALAATSDSANRTNAAPVAAIAPTRTPNPAGPIDLKEDFAQRAGQRKLAALMGTGGDESTEAAVQAALKFLASDQAADGSWDPASSGAGKETMTLGTYRANAGQRATNGLTGLALLSMLGAGNTHRDGKYADCVRRGLSYLIRSQHPDGSLAGPATTYESTYCHGMAALAMCEAAAMTGDPSAMRSATAALRYTVAMQHPTTGGWRYVKGDPGDLSQLGWQALVLDSAQRASITVPQQSLDGATRFLRSVRSGQNGGLACYRSGEAPSRTMTAEALSTRLLLGEIVPAHEVAEAEAYLLRQLPGVGKDNYYGWYYTAMALHQLQDDAWRQWNDAMKRRLLDRQEPSGSWPTDDEWGGYGGRVYTTATAALCLEVYYRHALRQNALVARESAASIQR